jgi:adenosylhomocysteine nucleosidase
MAAMPQEIAAILPHLQSVRVQTLAGRAFHHGTWHGQPVVAVLSGIGKVAAATTATLLCTSLAADHLVFTGVAGGLGADVAVGDVVLGTRFVQHDMDASPLFPRFELPGRGRAALDSDVALTQELARALDALHAHSEVWQSVQASGFVREGGSRLHHGLILSGDRFVGDAGLSQHLVSALPGALAVEMEGAAVAQVCHDLGVPFAVMRAISDRADAQAHVDFNAFLSAVASPMVAAWLDRCLSQRAQSPAI